MTDQHFRQHTYIPARQMANLMQLQGRMIKKLRPQPQNQRHSRLMLHLPAHHHKQPTVSTFQRTSWRDANTKQILWSHTTGHKESSSTRRNHQWPRSCTNQDFYKDQKTAWKIELCIHYWGTWINQFPRSDETSGMGRSSQPRMQLIIKNKTWVIVDLPEGQQ